MAMTASIAIHLLRLEAGLQSKSVQLYGVNCAANRFSRPLKQASTLHDSLLFYVAIVVFLFFFFTLPSSVPTSEALLPCHLFWHPPPPSTPRAHSALWPCPPEAHWRRCQIAGGLPSEGDTALLPSIVTVG